MKKKIFIFIFILFISSFFNKIYSQSNYIFNDSTYVDGLYKLYSDLPLKKKLDKNSKEISREEVYNFIVDFKSFWDSSEFDTGTREDIVHLTNYFTLKMRLNKKSEILSFLKLVVMLPQKSEKNFNTWLFKLNKMSKSKRTSISSLKIIINRTFVLINDSCIYKSKICRWKITNDDFEFKIGINDEFEIEIPKTDLIGEYTVKDTVFSSVKIKNTGGRYNPETNKWKGRKGLVTWEKYNLEKEKVSANLNNYNILLKNVKYEADSVVFNYKGLVDDNILGKLSDQASIWAEKNPVFPKFVSYKHNYSIKSLIKNVKLKGGIKMQGERLHTGGTAANPAVIKIFNKGRLFVRAESKSISQRSDNLMSKKTKIAMYNTENDSITHPDVKLEMKRGILILTRNEEGVGRAPFVNSYQEMDMSVDQLIWYTKEDKLKLYSEKSSKAYFNSTNFFSKADFESLQMQDDKNPLFLIKHYIRVINRGNDNTKTWKRKFYAKDFSAYLKKDPTAVRHRLMGLWYQGFLDYNTETELVKIKPKLYNYINSFHGRKDYDKILIRSKGEKETNKKGLYKILNAVYNLKTNDLDIKGPGKTLLSEPRMVAFVPNGEIRIKENRNMEFDGKLLVFWSIFHGKGFRVDYENFNISFDNIDSINYAVTRQPKKFKKENVTSTVENVSGVLQIDKKGNRSGKENNSNYPIFTSKTDSYVYYDKKNKAYDRKSFYFKCYPYQMDSMSFLHKNSLALKGFMKSGGIFSDFEDTLIVQKDNSLGFVHKLKDGEELYGGLGKIYAGGLERAFVSLDNDGFSGGGDIKWRTATISSDLFKFLPDMAKAKARKFKIERNNGEFGDAEYPDLEASDVDIVWDTKNEFIKCDTEKSQAFIYDKKVKMNGRLIYDEIGLTGNGKILFEESVIKSEKDFNFNENSFFSELSDTKLKDPENEIVLNAYGMKTYVDIKAEKSVFQSNSKSAKINFPKNKYDNYSDHFIWHHGKYKADINNNVENYTDPTKTEDNKLLNRSELVDRYDFSEVLFFQLEETSEFVALQKGKDSLRFKCTKAFFDAKTKEITVKEVKKIRVADIVVVPSSDVKIKIDAKIDKLFKTSVTAKGKHNIADVDIEITNRYEYNASAGTYLYIDEVGNSQNIFFSSIYYNNDKKASVAKGIIPEDRKFTLSPDFDFKGNVRFNATNDYLEFQGYAKQVHACETQTPWFNFISTINPKKVQIPLNRELNEADSKTRIHANIIIAPDSTNSIRSFPAFITTNPKGTSSSIFSVKDSVYYIYCDKSDKGLKYKITTKSKIDSASIPGNMMTYDIKNCIITATGDFDYARTLKYNLGAAGRYKYNLHTKEATLNVMTYFDFPFPNKLQNIMIDKIKDFYAAKPVDPITDSYQRNLNKLIGAEEGGKFITQLSERPDNPKFPDTLEHSLVLADLKMVWDDASESFKSVGKIGVGSIRNKVLNKYLKGYVLVEREIGTDFVYIYLEIDKSNWFYFRFHNNQMYMYSSVVEFNEHISKLKGKERKDEKTGYKFVLTNIDDKEDFIENFTGKRTKRKDEPPQDEEEETEEDY